MCACVFLFFFFLSFFVRRELPWRVEAKDWLVLFSPPESAYPREKKEEMEEEEEEEKEEALKGATVWRVS